MAPGDVTRSANRTFELLGAIVEHGGLTLGDAAKATDLATSTALRLIRSLEQTEFVVRGEDNVYRVGPRLLQIGARALGDNQLLPRARPAMKPSPKPRESRPTCRRRDRKTLRCISIRSRARTRSATWVGGPERSPGRHRRRRSVERQGRRERVRHCARHHRGSLDRSCRADLQRGRSDSRSAQRRRPDIPSDGRGLRQPRSCLGGALRPVVRGTRQPDTLTTPSTWRFSLVSETMWFPAPTSALPVRTHPT